MKHSEIPTERPAWIVWPELVILAPSSGGHGADEAER